MRSSRGAGRPGTAGRLIRPGLILTLVVAAAAASAQERGGERHGGAEGRGGPGAGPGSGNSYANPSAVLAAELALSRGAREQGEWTALAAAAAPDAMLMAPQPVWAQVWLKGRANPPVATIRQPAQVWASCDGTLAVSQGGWRRGDAFGWFAAVWQRQEGGGWKWLFTDAGPLAKPLPEPDMLSARVADCPERRRGAAGGAHPSGGKPAKPEKPARIKVKNLPPIDPTGRSGAAPDGSLRWSVRAGEGGRRRLSVVWKKDGAEQAVLDETAGPDTNFR